MSPKLKPVKEEGKIKENEGQSGTVTESDNENSIVPKQVVLSKTFRKFLKRFLKGFGSGLGVYTGIKFVTALMRNPFRER